MSELTQKHHFAAATLLDRLAKCLATADPVFYQLDVPADEKACKLPI